MKSTQKATGIFLGGSPGNWRWRLRKWRYRWSEDIVAFFLSWIILGFLLITGYGLYHWITWIPKELGL